MKLPELNPNYKPQAVMDMCRCNNCDWSGKVDDAIAEIESDGWEYPEYTVHNCPKCEEGFIEDYWYSDEEIEKLELEK